MTVRSSCPSQQLAAAVVENNLNLAVDRYNNYFAQADLLRTKSGQAARGVDSAGAIIPDALFSAAIGAGVGGGGGRGGSVSGSRRHYRLDEIAQLCNRAARLIRPLTFDFSWDRTASPLNTLVVAGVSGGNHEYDLLHVWLAAGFHDGNQLQRGPRQSTPEQYAAILNLQS